MTTAKQDPIEDLDHALENTLQLHRATNVTEWLDSKWDRSYLARTPVRMAHHFDLGPAFLIRDSVLSTLGIVEEVLPGKGSIAEQVRKHVDSAAYARHLLLRDPGRSDSPALTVELVLLTSGDEEVAQSIGDELRDLLRKTDSLLHVGIGLLRHEGGAHPFGDSLRRGLPWLLTATRAWLANLASRPPVAPADPPRRVQSLSLSNYRLAGRRELALASSRVHLIHGANGSGKSSLVEAIELLACGTIDRLRGEDYERIIKNRDSREAASIEWSWGDDAREKRQVVATGLDPAPAGGVRASSFRLDQSLMEELVGRGPHERANSYLQAFFPEAAESLAAYASAIEARAKAREGLMQPLALLKEARTILEGIQGWQGGGVKPTREPLEDLVNKWLERTALADLAQREHTVRATLKAAGTEGWSFPHEPATGILTTVDLPLPILDAQARRWSNEAEELQKELASLRPTSPQELQSPEGETRPITQDQCATLNVVGRWLFDQASVTEAFGDKVFRVMAVGDPPTYGTTVIGRAGWAAPVLSQLEALIRACEKLGTSDEAAVPWPGREPVAAYDAAVTQQNVVVKAGSELSKGFLDKLGRDSGPGELFNGSLIAAVNELMALFTPARWGYHDIHLPAALADGRPGIAIELGEGAKAVRAELQLNTAELNLFTVALFLLCASRVKKPLRLLILDDPLQNMDELTTTALARGLAKVVRAWERAGRDDDLFLFFHGSEDLDRFQAEMTSATYRLPWLSPSRDQKVGLKIVAERTSRKAEVQRLDDLVEAVP